MASPGCFMSKVLFVDLEFWLEKLSQKSVPSRLIELPKIWREITRNHCRLRGSDPSNTRSNKRFNPLDEFAPSLKRKAVASSFEFFKYYVLEGSKIHGLLIKILVAPDQAICATEKKNRHSSLRQVQNPCLNQSFSSGQNCLKDRKAHV